MNTVERLLTSSFHFSKLSFNEKLEVKQLGRPTPNLSIEKAGQSKKKNYIRKFNPIIYTEYDWLCGCDIRNSVFCFPCLLFNGEDSWSKTGVTDLKHLKEKLKKHHNSAKHINNVMELAVFGRANIATQLDSGYRVSIKKYNEQVDKNRYILSKLIDCVKFCGAFELALRGHDETYDSDNPGVFLGLVDFVSSLDDAMKLHLEKATVFKGTSKTIQNELLDCMLEICREKIIDEINNAQFVAVMADETTDVSETMQMVIVYRYELNGNAVERFWGFFNPGGQNADSLSACIIAELDFILQNKKDKLIAQSYDGAAVMSGAIGGVQVKVRTKYPFAYFIHCYAHQLNLIMERAASQNMSARVFFCKLSAIPAFFSRSPQRLEALDAAVAKRIPKVIVTRWNFKIRTVNAIYENQEALIRCFENLENSPTSRSITVQEASGLRHYLEDPDFVFWLTFFHRIMPHVDILYDQLQSRQIDSVKMNNAICEFKINVVKVRNQVDEVEKEVSNSINVVQPKKKRIEVDKCNSLSIAAKEVCDVITVEAQNRFAFSDHLIASKLLFPENFQTFSIDFPETELDFAVKAYPMLQKERLRTELTVLYQRDDFHNIDGAIALLQLFLNNNISSTFTETLKLLRILITTPMTTSEPERCFSALKRVKTFSRNTMIQDRLNALAMLSIEKGLVSSIKDLNNKVIEKFAHLKNRRMDFLYK